MARVEHILFFIVCFFLTDKLVLEFFFKKIANMLLKHCYFKWKSFKYVSIWLEVYSNHFYSDRSELDEMVGLCLHWDVLDE